MNLPGAALWSVLQRGYPNANCVLLRGERPVLVDAGHAGDSEALLAWLAAEGVVPSLVVNTHAHSDHVGGNAALQRMGLPVAADAADAALVNARDPEACDARWLGQAIPPYRVDTALRPGDVIETGLARWQVLATRGHARGHISLYCEDAGLLVAGDLFHAGDIGWLPPPSREPGAMDAAHASLQAVAGLNMVCAVSGHGPPITDPVAAVDACLARLSRWREQPEASAWHACKRILSHAIIERDGMSEASITSLLQAAPWFADYARDWFAHPAEAMVAPLVTELLRSGAARRHGGTIVANAERVPLAPGWRALTALPQDWPA